MAEMTEAERKVRERWPDALIYVSGYDGCYYISNEATNYDDFSFNIGNGTIPSEAWQDAASRIEQAKGKVSE